MPDRHRGYVKRHAGILPSDDRMAQLYRANLKQAAVHFTGAIQRDLIAGGLEACKSQNVRCHFIATETTHVHVLLSWRTDRTWKLVRKQVRSNITRRLNATFIRQEWFSKSPSRKRVKVRKHFDYLVATYLPNHSGWKWSEARGLFR
jgi:hypothetical protein